MPLKLVKNEKGLNKGISLKGLNESQLEAVTTIAGPVLIIAGAGSGKTRVLTHRIAFLIEQGINPSNILALTFTNKAAGEMRERISTLVPANAANSVWAGTFHSIFARILRIEADKLGYTSSFSIYDTDDSLALVRRILNQKGITDKNFSPQNVRNRISWAKNQMLSWDRLHSESTYSNDKTIADVYKDYEEELKLSNAMDFDDLLIKMITLFSNHTDVMHKYRERFKYLLVDEYQDTNRPQYLVCKLLSGGHQNICVVGDDAQSIYKWRGAEIRNILEFKKDFPDTRVVRLERNYRSTKNILAAADSAIKFNRNQLEKNLWTDNPAGDKINIIECRDDIDEADYVITKIKKLIAASDFDEKDFAVLYRTNAQSLTFENACRKNKLPHIIVGGMSFYKRKEVKDVYSYLKFICNTKDSESLLRIINEPPRGIGKTTINHFIAYAQENSLSLFEAFMQSAQIPELKTRARNSVSLFVKMINEMLELMNTLPADEFAKEFIENTGLMQMYSDIGTDDALDRWNNIQQVVTDISLFFRELPDADLVGYLQQISLVSEIDEKDMNQPSIKLMTLHSAKGLEFPIVFIAGMEKGLFPFSRSENNPDEEEEERRLFYVGITRAMEKLTITYANRRMRFGDYAFQSPSKFLAEIDKNVIDINSSFARGSLKPDIKPSIKAQKSYDSYSQLPPDESTNDDASTVNLKVGDKCRHTHFGLGQVVMLTGEGQNRAATVNFQTVGRKKLMLQYAKLQKV